jgi:signal transduction histidine kinase/AmiR/NasT family two-component response regulator
MERETICFPHFGTQKVLQTGDQGFKEEIDRLYHRAESNALEALISLKASLGTLSTDDFWAALVEGIASIIGAQISFIFKRMLVDNHDAAVEMPPYGEPGSCLMASAVHFCTHDGSNNTIKETKFHAYGCPCTYMRHDKVFLIPENLNDFIANNPNKLPTPAEAYIALPLFADGKNIAHFGAMWSKEGAAERQLSWAFIEMLLHSLEDMVLQRLKQGSNFLRPAAVTERRSVIPHDAVSVAQSLRPYAGSLSHELRTPMQGIVGMLDVMYTSVQEAVETQKDPHLRRIFRDLKENIEVVQDSSRRAVEAADNVVHAYDMDMSLPDAPPPLLDDLELASPFSAAPADRRPEIFVAGSNLPLSRKRRREETSFYESGYASSNKTQKVASTRSSWSQSAELSQALREGVRQATQVQQNARLGATLANVPTAEDAELAAGSTSTVNRIIAPGLRHTNMREVFQHVINEGLKVGGRPDSTIAQETKLGEIVEVRTRGSDGTAKTKFIEWDVDTNTPRTLFTDERDLSKLISCVFLNAIKFTDQNGGRVRLFARMSQRGRYISIKVSDNGPGIPAAFIPKLYKAFSRENESITRQSEGLGLGLMVAKGLARKLGGDLLCTKAVTEGPDHGSEFEIKVPVTAGETISRPTSPFGSPMPHAASLAPLAIPGTPPSAAVTPFAQSPTKLCQDLQETFENGTNGSDRYFSPSISPKTESHIQVPKPPVTITSSPPTPPNGLNAGASRPRIRKSFSNPEIDRDLANKYPLTFLVAEDNKINRKLLVSMLSKFGYKCIHEAHDGAEAVRQMAVPRVDGEKIDVVLMDLWMPLMDGYEATERILGKYTSTNGSAHITQKPTVLAVTADVTDGAQERAARVGMKGFMTKPYKIHDLQRLITEYCAHAHRATTQPMEVC